MNKAKHYRKRQILTFPAKRFLDRRVSSYILMDAYLDQTAVHPLIKGKYSAIGFPYKGEQEVLDANEYIVGLVRRMIAVYGEKLNQYHQVQWDNRQWNTVLCVWMHFILFDAYTRYQQLGQLAGQTDVYMLAPGSYDMEPGMADNYRGLIRSQMKNAYMWALIANYMGMEVKAVRGPSAAEDLVEKAKIGWVDPKRVREFVFRKLKSLAGKGQPIQEAVFCNISKENSVLLYETSLPKEIETCFASRSGGVIGRIDGAGMRRESALITGRYAADGKLRKKVFKGVFKPQDAFEQLAEKLVVRCLPTAYLEAFHELYAKAQDITAVWDIKELYTTYTSVELMDFCCALQLKKGLRINVIQHSGVYGGMYPYHIENSMYADRFFTWGWNWGQFDYLDAEICPAAIIRFPQKPEKQIPIKDKILVACNYGQFSDGGGGFYFGEYVHRQMEFLDALTKDVRKTVVLRVDPRDDINLELIRRCRKKYPYVRIENRYEVPYLESMMESRFVVCDYFGSTHLEAMICGKPFVMYQAADITACTKGLKKFQKEFKACGIYADTPKEMAAQLNMHAENDDWLKTSQVKEICRRYQKEFIGVEKDLFSGGDQDIYEKWYHIFMGGKEV